MLSLLIFKQFLDLGATYQRLNELQVLVTDSSLLVAFLRRTCNERKADKNQADPCKQGLQKEPYFCLASLPGWQTEHIRLVASLARSFSWLTSHWLANRPDLKILGSLTQIGDWRCKQNEI